MVTDSDPCATAAGVTRTSAPITTVPVREFTITRAGASPGSTSIALQRREIGNALIGIQRRRHLHRHGIHRLGGARAEQIVDAPQRDATTS